MPDSTKTFLKTWLTATAVFSALMLFKVSWITTDNLIVVGFFAAPIGLLVAGVLAE